MSRFTSPPRSSSAPLDEAAEARELEEFFRRQNPVDIAAVDWHTRREQGLTADEQAEFQHWLAASPAHVAAFERLDQGMAALRSMPDEDTAKFRSIATPAFSQPASPPDLSSQTSQTGRGRQAAGKRNRAWLSLSGLRRRQAALAFCCMTVLAVGIGWYHWSQQIFSESYVIARGPGQTITLPDGTELVFDAETQAQVNLYKDRREVRITEGQIMFAVTPDSEKPFQVLAGPARVTVLGTRFSVRYRHAGMDAGGVKVAVEQGHVRVADARNEASTGAVDLVAGQGIDMAPDGVISQVASVAPDSIALWRRGLVRFENTSLGDALLELERYGPTGLVIRDPAVAGLTIGGSYQINRPDAFARMVSQILPVRLVRNASGEIEIAKAK